MSRSRSSALALGAAVLALLFAACGDDGGGRPSAAEVSDAIQSSGDDELTEEQADCIAEAYVDSDISDEGLNTLTDSADIENIEDVDISDDDREAFEAATAEAISCATEGLDVPADPGATEEGG